jgi:hypothetical protein
MRTMIIAAAALLAACGQSAPSTMADQTDSAHQTASTDVAAQAAPSAPSAPPSLNNCLATASSRWIGVDGAHNREVIEVEASATGADCASALATISFHGPAGTQSYSETHPVSEVSTLAGAQTTEDMQRRLARWVAPPRAAHDMTSDLPEWREDEPTPRGGFSPDPDFNDQRIYTLLRIGDGPMFCFAQTMDSQTCVLADHGNVSRFGVQHVAR